MSIAGSDAWFSSNALIKTATTNKKAPAVEASSLTDIETDYSSAFFSCSSATTRLQLLQQPPPSCPQPPQPWSGVDRATPAPARYADGLLSRCRCWSCRLRRFSYPSARADNRQLRVGPAATNPKRSGITVTVNEGPRDRRRVSQGKRFRTNWSAHAATRAAVNRAFSASLLAFATTLGALRRPSNELFNGTP